jgi:hypothetical protein
MYEFYHRKKHGEKVALLSHSMGANYVLYFLRWVTEQAGDQWIDEKLETKKGKNESMFLLF